MCVIIGLYNIAKCIMKLHAYVVFPTSTSFIAVTQSEPIGSSCTIPVVPIPRVNIRSVSVTNYLYIWFY
jgi:hypothetical protein